MRLLYCSFISWDTLTGFLHFISTQLFVRELVQPSLELFQDMLEKKQQKTTHTQVYDSLLLDTNSRISKMHLDCKVFLENS